MGKKTTIKETTSKVETLETTILVITPGSNTTTPEVFFVTDSKTGELLAQKHSVGPLFAKQDLLFEFEAEWAEKYDSFELKFIDETNILMDELASLTGQWERSAELKLEKAQLADDEQPEPDEEVADDEHPEFTDEQLNAIEGVHQEQLETLTVNGIILENPEIGEISHEGDETKVGPGA